MKLKDEYYSYNFSLIKAASYLIFILKLSLHSAEIETNLSLNINSFNIELPQEVLLSIYDNCSTRVKLELGATNWLFRNHNKVTHLVWDLYGDTQHEININDPSNLALELKKIVILCRNGFPLEELPFEVLFEAKKQSLIPSFIYNDGPSAYNELTAQYLSHDSVVTLNQKFNSTSKTRLKQFIHCTGPGFLALGALLLPAVGMGLTYFFLEQSNTQALETRNFPSWWRESDCSSYCGNFVFNPNTNLFTYSSSKNDSYCQLTDQDMTFLETNLVQNNNTLENDLILSSNNPHTYFILSGMANKNLTIDLLLYSLACFVSDRSKYTYGVAGTIAAFATVIILTVSIGSKMIHCLCPNKSIYEYKIKKLDSLDIV